MLYTYIKTVSNSIEQQQYWTVADSDLQLRGGGGAGARGGHPDPEIRGEEPSLKKKFVFGPLDLSLVLK